MSHTEGRLQKLPVSARNIFAAICILAAASATVWLVIPHLSITYTCAFRDISALRRLWPGNQPIYDELALWHGAINDECNFFLSSILSIFFSIFSILFYTTLLSKTEPATMRPRPVIATLVMAFMIIGMLAGGFNHHATGRGAWGAFLTTDSTNTLLWKTLVRELVIYFFCPIWISHLRVAWLQRSSL
ncbi:hypothetical protein EOA13_29520 [Mesorhizobium sp. M7A.F.Ca.US.011.01.1.1]|uniref:hypothetical protein n=1 Tax=Mesorhizobium sp. M7A.F.Ca.US.011.01.1.1 TaxID=2496741 RepID=UPI000FCCCC88|nr:hypothetical protein [Mesorhizobium sp. M7A.F.Ca.US.011.01.1.1]RUX24790.1 hypothetical protein EOA13_29520 [Mesorhizobium sp. M7A.F.Ca.US.011.01.1.1]